MAKTVKMEIEIPEWANTNHIFLFHGIELIGVKRVGAPWVVKEGRCSRCGSCCMEKHIMDLPMPKKDGQCIFLSKNKDDQPHCSWEAARPWCCCIGEPKAEPNCTITWRYMEGVGHEDTVPKPQTVESLEELAESAEENVKPSVAKVVSQGT